MDEKRPTTASSIQDDNSPGFLPQTQPRASCGPIGILQAAITRYGEKAQLVQCCEELAELTQAVSKAYRFGLPVAWNELAEEMADVEIMLEQLYLMLPRLREDVPLWRENKLARLKQRLDRMEELS